MRRAFFIANGMVAALFVYAIGQALIHHGIGLAPWEIFYFGSTGFSLAVLLANMWAFRG